MQTLLEVLKKSEDFLHKKGVVKAKFNAEWLIADALGYTRLDMFLHYERVLGEEELVHLRERIRRRGLREPLQYIIGHTPFVGLNLLTDKRALIPRPETEELVDRVIHHLKPKSPARILDLGTGSGALALALAQHFSQAEVVAVDASKDALNLASENARRNQLERIQFLQGNWFEPVNGKFDLIVANPPYLSESEWTVAEPEVKLFEPKDALVATLEGTSDLFKIIHTAQSFLNEGGLLAVETGIDHKDTLETTVLKNGYFQRYWAENDFSGRQRYFYLIR